MRTVDELMSELLRLPVGEREEVAGRLLRSIDNPSEKDPPSRGHEMTNSKDGSVLVQIPGGAFTMGSFENEREKPPHQVSLPDYFIGKHAVTNLQFAKFVSATHHKAVGDWARYHAKWGDNAPVVEVTWNDAVAYCQWAGLRLPTEPEWEKAARGTDGRRYPWGNDWDPSRCRNSVGTSDSSGASAVDSYPSGVSPYGCLGLAGNVYQWCSSKAEPYPYDALDGREDQEHSALYDRVMRGGGWDIDDANYFRTSYRGSSPPGFHLHYVGFRVAADLGRVLASPTSGGT